MGRSRLVLFTAEAAKERFHLGEEQKNIVRESKSMTEEDKFSHAQRVLQKRIETMQRVEERKSRAQCCYQKTRQGRTSREKESGSSNGAARI